MESRTHYSASYPPTYPTPTVTRHMSGPIPDFIAGSYMLSTTLAMMVTTTWSRNIFFPWIVYVLVQYIILWYVGHRAMHENLPFLDAVLIVDCVGAYIGVFAGWLATLILWSPRLLALQYDRRGVYDKGRNWGYMWMGIGQVLIILIVPLILHDALVPYRPWDIVIIPALIIAFLIAYATHRCMSPEFAVDMRTDRTYDGKEMIPRRSLVAQSDLTRFYTVYGGLCVWMTTAFVTMDNILWGTGISPTSLDPVWRILTLVIAAILYLFIMWLSISRPPNEPSPPIAAAIIGAADSYIPTIQHHSIADSYFGRRQVF